MMPLGAPPPPPPLALSSDIKYNLYDTGLSEIKPFNDVNGMLQQIMSIVDQSLDEAQARFVFNLRKKNNNHFGFDVFLGNMHLIKVDLNQLFFKYFVKSKKKQVN
jgi:hypothetical protein